MWFWCLRELQGWGVSTVDHCNTPAPPFLWGCCLQIKTVQTSLASLSLGGQTPNNTIPLGRTQASETQLLQSPRCNPSVGDYPMCGSTALSLTVPYWPVAPETHPTG